MYELVHLTLIILALAELINKGDGQDFGYEGAEAIRQTRVLSILGETSRQHEPFLMRRTDTNLSSRCGRGMISLAFVLSTNDSHLNTREIIRDYYRHKYHQCLCSKIFMPSISKIGYYSLTRRLLHTTEQSIDTICIIGVLKIRAGFDRLNTSFLATPNVRCGTIANKYNGLHIIKDNLISHIYLGVEIGLALRSPDFWGNKFAQCVGKHQSPINIDDHNVEEVEMLPLIYENFKNEADLAVTNNGHTVQFKLNTNPMPTITGGPLLGKYKFTQFHFHWGAHDEEGSENRINSHSFPMELHVVFYGTAYGTFENATQHPDGLCVVSFLYSKSEEDNDNYKQIINLLPQVNEVGNSAKGTDPIALELLLTEDKEHYYTYGGSLTTPPCTEDVTWIEFKSTIPLSHKQIEAFRQLRSAHGKLNHNFRPTQSLNGRVIRTNKDISCKNIARGSSSYKTSSLFTLVGAIGASVFINLI